MEKDANNPASNSRSRLKTHLRWSRCCSCILLILLLILLFFLTIFLIHYLNDKESVEDEAKKSVCYSPDCIRVAADLMDSLDENVDPCEDFYGNVCGGWVKKNPIPRGVGHWAITDVQNHENQLFIRGLLERSETPEDSPSLVKSRAFYTSCMAAINKENSSEPLLGAIWEQLGGWNLTSPPPGFVKKPLTADSILETFIKAQQFNKDVFFYWNVREGIQEKSNVVYIQQGGLTLPTHQLYLKDNVAKLQLISYISSVVKLLGGKPKHEQIKEQIHGIVKVETILALIGKDEELTGLSGQLIHPKLDEFFPLSNDTWLDFFTRIVETSYPHAHYPNMDFFDANEFFVTLDPLLKGALDKNYAQQAMLGKYLNKASMWIQKNYMKNLKNWIEAFKLEDGFYNDLNNYIVWRAIVPYVNTLGKDFIRAKSRFRRDVLGKKGSKLRWKTCVSRTTDTLGFAFAPEFIKEKVPENGKKMAEEMLESIKLAFISQVPSLDWPTEVDKYNMEFKLKEMTYQVGYPQMALNQTHIDWIYKDFEVSNESMFDNEVSYYRFELKRKLSQLGKNDLGPRWKYEGNDTNSIKKVLLNGDENWMVTMAPTTVNAYHMFPQNQIIIPGGLLSLPLFSSSQPMSLNYGYIGNFMGHEVAHGFDATGKLFDAYGDFSQTWWSNQTLSGFANVTQCFKDQYTVIVQNMISDKVSLADGNNTLSENMADNGGLISAYMAYKNWQEENEDQSLPGMNYTDIQMFFLGFGRSHCDSMKPQLRELSTLWDNHSPARLRVNIALSNMQEFASAWQCPMKSTMVLPEENTCKIW